MILKKNSTPVQTSSAVFYEGVGWAIGPKKPTPEAVAKAQFVDKTYHWKNARIRSRD